MDEKGKFCIIHLLHFQSFAKGKSFLVSLQQPKRKKDVHCVQRAKGSFFLNLPAQQPHFVFFVGILHIISPVPISKAMTYPIFSSLTNPFESAKA